MILGYGKGKVPEKCICTNCLRKGIECEWDEGGQGKSKTPFFFLTCTDQSNRKVLHAMLEQQDQMHAQKIRALVIEKATH